MYLLSNLLAKHLFVLSSVPLSTKLFIQSFMHPSRINLSIHLTNQPAIHPFIHPKSFSSTIHFYQPSIHPTSHPSMKLVDETKSAFRMFVYQAIHRSSCPTKRLAISQFSSTNRHKTSSHQSLLVHQQTHKIPVADPSAIRLALQPPLIQPCQPSILSSIHLNVKPFLPIPNHLFIRTVILPSSQPFS